MHFLKVLMLWGLLSTPAIASDLTFYNFNQATTLKLNQHKDSELFGVNTKTNQEFLVNGEILAHVDNHFNNQSLLDLDYVAAINTVFEAKSWKVILIRFNKPKQIIQNWQRLSELKTLKFLQPNLLPLSALGFRHTPNTSTPIKVTESTLKKVFSSANSNKGEGINVAIIDDGFALKGGPLSHLKPIFSYDIETRQLNSEPKLKNDTHGTKIAQLFFNPKFGLLPQANLIAIRQVNSWTADTLLALHLAHIAKADVINCAWNSAWLSQYTQLALDYLSHSGRGGKGLAIVFAAGNQGGYIAANSIEASINSAIVVGALNGQQQIHRRSNYGPTVDVYVQQWHPIQTTPKPLSGTSLTSSLITAVIAQKLSKQPNLTAKELSTSLIALGKIAHIPLKDD
ncbi:S8 family serine peptidase [Paraferrimonas sp. SM1919]|uniref:S8 family peptidase n=1 Tax=Paraferrimonas sp. SM1919 TaxID=2662263 RepID=UPI0013D081A9|nr:S8 family serine peptidase [Paraferrimonas sp. SM1919]